MRRLFGLLPVEQGEGREFSAQAVVLEPVEALEWSLLRPFLVQLERGQQPVRG